MARKGLPASIIRKYGISKKAWDVYRGRRKTKSRSSKSRKSRKSRRGNPVAKRTWRRRAGRIFGNVSWKGLLAGSVSLVVAKYLAKRFAPVPPRYVNGVAMVGASFIPIGGTKALRTAGIMDLASEFGSDLLIGGLPTVGMRGYDV